jgi:hypothetical protein
VLRRGRQRVGPVKRLTDQELAGLVMKGRGGTPKACVVMAGELDPVSDRIQIVERLEAIPGFSETLRQRDVARGQRPAHPFDLGCDFVKL